MTRRTWNVLVTGGAGYVGSVLVPQLLAAGHRVTVLDLYLYGDVLEPHPNLREVRGDIRDIAAVKDALQGIDAVIHLACISNDPSYDLNPELGRSVNHAAFLPLVRAAKQAGVERFIYASSSSVYGIKDEPNVSEELPLEPLTDYSKFKAICEEELEAERTEGFCTCIIRPSTVCGYAPRQRLDVVVNIFANHAFHNGRIRIFGGSQKRPNIHINDMVALYLFLLEQPAAKIDGEVFNAGYENHTLMELADIVREVSGRPIELDVEATDDLRSYHVSSEKMRRQLGFVPTHDIADAVRGLFDAFESGRLPYAMTDSRYFNIKRMQEVDLT